MAPSPPLASAGGAGAASSGRRGRRARPRRQGRRGVAQRTRTPNPARSRPRAVPGTSATVRRPPTITTLPASRAAGPAGVELCALWPAGSAGAPSLLARVVGRARTPQSAFPRGPAAVRSPGPPPPQPGPREALSTQAPVHWACARGHGRLRGALTALWWDLIAMRCNLIRTPQK